MLRAWLSRLHRNVLGSLTTPAPVCRRPAPFRPLVENLGDRLVPSAFSGPHAEIHRMIENKYLPRIDSLLNRHPHDHQHAHHRGHSTLGDYLRGDVPMPTPVPTPAPSTDILDAVRNLGATPTPTPTPSWSAPRTFWAPSVPSSSVYSGPTWDSAAFNQEWDAAWASAGL